MRDVDSRSTQLFWARVALVGVTLAALFWRRPDAFINPQFVAEDGPIFFLGARNLGVASLWKAYASYIHLYPRMVALAFSGLSAPVMPVVYLTGNVLAVLFTALLCTSRRVDLPTGVRFMLGLAVTLAPTQNEVFHTLTNSQWILSLTLILALLFKPPVNKKQWAFDICLLLIVGLTGPFALLFSVLYLVRVLASRDRHGWAMMGVVMAVTLVQATRLSVPRSEGSFGVQQAIDSIHVLNGYLGRTFAGSAGRPAPEGLPWVVGLLAAGLLLHAALLVDGWRRRTLVPFYFLGGAALILGSTLLAFKSEPQMLKANGDRYFYVPITLLVWTLCAAWPAHKRLVSPALLAAALAFVLSSTRSPARPDYNWRVASRCLDEHRPCTVNIPPGGWIVRVE